MKIVMAVTALFLGVTVVAAMPTAKERMLSEAKISLPEAVAKAAPEAKDGSPVSARLKEEKGRIVYVVGVAQGETEIRFSMDAKTNELIGKTTVSRSHAKELALAKVSVLKAVEAALKKVPGKATGVEMEIEKGKAIIEVKIFNEGKSWEVEVDAATGEVIEVEQDDDDGDDDEDDDDGDDKDD